jgi:hypothetical protein
MWRHLIEKEAFIFRKEDHEMDISNWLNHLLTHSMKLIIRTPAEGPYAAMHPHPKLIFLNCLLSPSQRARVAESIMERITAEQPQAIRQTLTHFRPLVATLVEQSLIDLNGLEHLFLELSQAVVQSLKEQQGRAEQLELKQFVFYKLNRIRRHFEELMEEEVRKETESGLVIQEVLKSIADFERLETPETMQVHHFQHLSRIRAKFFDPRERTRISLQSP